MRLQLVSGAVSLVAIGLISIASGNLRHERVFESEDELGELSRSFEQMAGALRTTVGEMAGAADRVESTAGEIETVSGNVAAVSTDQKLGIERVSSAMDAINTQVQGIASSSAALNDSVEESSTSIGELSAHPGAISTRRRACCRLESTKFPRRSTSW